MFEPITFPMATSPIPRSADDTDTNNSGAEVPKPTMVKPITKSEICSRLAIATEASTK